MNISTIIRSNSNEVKNVKYLFILQIVDKITPLIVVPYLMVTLGADKYGYIGFSSAIIQYLILLSNFGFSLSATQRIAIAKDREAVSKIFFSTLIARLLLLFMGTIIMALVVYSFKGIQEYSSTILYMYPMAFGAALSASWLFQGIGKIRITAVVSSLCRLLILPLNFLLVKNATDYNVAASIQAIVYLIASIIDFIVLYRLKVIKKINIKFIDVICEIKESYPLFLSNFATSAYTQLFTVILGFFSNPTIVGRYSAAEKIMRSLCFAIYSPISAAFYPKISKLAVEDKERAKTIISKLIKIALILMLCLSVCLLIFANPISVLLGGGYEGISSILRIISPAPIAIALGAIYGQMGLIAMGNSTTKDKFKKVYYVAAVFSVSSVFVLTYFFVEIGASVSLLLTEFLVFFLMYHYCKNNK